MNPTGQQLAVILFLLLLFFGARRLPDLARSMGSSIKEFRSAATEAVDHGPDSPTEPSHEVE